MRKQYHGSFTQETARSELKNGRAAQWMDIGIGTEIVVAWSECGYASLEYDLNIGGPWDAGK